MASLNSCQFIGNLGRDPEVRSTQSGDKCANFTIACTEKWKDRNGDQKERTTWVPVVIWGPLADVAGKYLRKGSKVFVSGKFTVRKWKSQDGSDRYATEIVLQGHHAQMIMLDSASSGDRGERKQPADTGGGWGSPGDLDDEIPW